MTVVAEQPRTARYTPTIDWGYGTGVDTSAYNDVSRFYLNGPGLVIDGIGRDQLRAYAPPKAPAFDLTLTNADGRFSPGGPLATFLGRGPTTTLDASWGTDVGADDADVPANDAVVLANGVQPVRLFTGQVDDMPQAISRGERTVQVRALGRLAWLLDKRPTTRLYEAIRTDQAIAVILDAVGWPADRRQIDSGDTTLVYWWLNGQTTALAALNALLAAEGAGSCAYEDGDGTFHFEGRQFRQNHPRSLTDQFVFYDGPRSQTTGANDEAVLANSPTVLANGPLDNLLFHVVPAEYRSNPDEVVKTVTARVNVRTPTAVQKVWEYGGPLVLAASQAVDLEVTAAEPFKAAVVPVAGVDYALSAGSLAGVSLLETSGQTVTLRLVAGAGGATVIGVTSNGIQVRAVSLPVTSELVVRSTIDTSQASARSRPKDYDLPCWPEIEPNQALDLVNSLALRYQRERRQVVFRIVNLDAAHLRAILNLRVSDRVRFVHTHAGLNDPYWVEQLRHEVAPGGGLHTLTVGCERVFDLSGGRYGQATYDVSVYGE